VTEEPGRLLERIAARVVDAATYERVLRPLLADLQFEHARASGGAGRALARLRGTLGFWRVLLPAVAGALAWGATAAEIDATRRRGAHALWATLGVGVLLFALLPQPLPALRRETVLLLPSTLAVAVPLGILFATALGRQVENSSHRRAVKRIAVIAGLLTFANAAWWTPRANQGYRERAFRILGQSPAAVLEPGDREMTLGRLSERSALLHSRGDRAGAARLDAEWHKKPALGVWCFALALLGAALAATGWRRAFRAGAAFMLAAGLSLALRGAEVAADTGRWPAALAMWLPVVSSLAAGQILLRAACHRSPERVVSA
jgi:hypothetical protein